MTKRILTALVLGFTMAAAHAVPGEGMVVVESPHTVGETADRAVVAIEDKGLKLFARIDHAAGAQAAGLALRPTQLLIFGNPKAGTPLMHCSPTVAIDLPQKLLIWQDEQGVTRVGYNAPAWLEARHGLTGCRKVLQKVGKALAGIASAAAE